MTDLIQKNRLLEKKKQNTGQSEKFPSGLGIGWKQGIIYIFRSWTVILWHLKCPSFLEIAKSSMYWVGQKVPSRKCWRWLRNLVCLPLCESELQTSAWWVETHLCWPVSQGYGKCWAKREGRRLHIPDPECRQRGRAPGPSVLTLASRTVPRTLHWWTQSRSRQTTSPMWGTVASFLGTHGLLGDVVPLLMNCWDDSSLSNKKEEEFFLCSRCLIWWLQI